MEAARFFHPRGHPTTSSTSDFLSKEKLTDLVGRLRKSSFWKILGQQQPFQSLKNDRTKKLGYAKRTVLSFPKPTDRKTQLAVDRRKFLSTDQRNISKLLVREDLESSNGR